MHYDRGTQRNATNSPRLCLRAFSTNLLPRQETSAMPTAHGPHGSRITPRSPEAVKELSRYERYAQQRLRAPIRSPLTPPPNLPSTLASSSVRTLQTALRTPLAVTRATPSHTSGRASVDSARVPRPPAASPQVSRQQAGAACRPRCPTLGWKLLGVPRAAQDPLAGSPHTAALLPAALPRASQAAAARHCKPLPLPPPAAVPPPPPGD